AHDFSRPDGREPEDAARGGARRDRPPHQLDSAVGTRPDLQHGREPSGLVHLATARLGRADSGARLHEMRRGDSDDRAGRDGGDILRLWVAMNDFTQEIRIGKEVLARAVEAYRKIRNTLRYLVANLYDFDPAVDRVPFVRLEEIDRYILGRYGELGRRILQAY